ncbi:PE domain-containing protein [Mycobacterium riyadhense]|uniref:PE domain-containing protein n=1 Tax=Mycobacterium riyadhense TaxID=486698 RepID=UPI001EF9E7D2|nr:PE domain-containing protein [Mycobacterium riyadhense]
MSFVIAVPEALVLAAKDLAEIGLSARAASAGAAAPTTGCWPPVLMTCRWRDPVRQRRNWAQFARWCRWLRRDQWAPQLSLGSRAGACDWHVLPRLSSPNIHWRCP